MRLLATVAAAGLLAACGGCMPSLKLAEGDLDRYVSLSPAVPADAQPYRPMLGLRQLPSKWVIHQKPSVIWSTVSILRAAERLKEGGEQIDLSVSPAHAKTLAGIFAQARSAIENLAEISTSDRPVNRQRWADGLATALVRLEYVSRVTTLEGAAGRTGDTAEPMGIAAGPMLELVTSYLNAQTDGSLLEDLTPQDVERLRAVLVQMALRLGFAAAGRQMPGDLREAVAARLQEAERLDGLEKSLAKILVEAADRAAPDATGQGIAGTFRTVLAMAPAALKTLESFVSQWDRIDRIELDLLRQDDRPVVAITVRVLPGKEVRLARPAFYVPAIVFRGASRIVVQPELPGTGEAVIAFEPIGDGAVEMRFEGLAYGLARALVMPLADGALREVRVFAKTRQEGAQVIHFALLMEAKGGKGDPRRMLVLQDVRHKRLVREPFDVRSAVEETEQVFNYLTPDRRYTYRRVVGPQG